MNWLKNKGQKCCPKTFEGSLFEEVFRGTKNKKWYIYINKKLI